MPPTRDRQRPRPAAFWSFWRPNARACGGEVALTLGVCYRRPMTRVENPDPNPLQEHTQMRDQQKPKPAQGGTRALMQGPPKKDWRYQKQQPE